MFESFPRQAALIAAVVLAFGPTRDLSGKWTSSDKGIRTTWEFGPKNQFKGESRRISPPSKSVYSEAGTFFLKGGRLSVHPTEAWINDGKTKQRFKPLDWFTKINWTSNKGFSTDQGFKFQKQ
jgi:hypothetical protein